MMTKAGFVIESAKLLPEEGLTDLDRLWRRR